MKFAIVLVGVLIILLVSGCTQNQSQETENYFASIRCGYVEYTENVPEIDLRGDIILYNDVDDISGLPFILDEVPSTAFVEIDPMVSGETAIEINIKIRLASGLTMEEDARTSYKIASPSYLRIYAKGLTRSDLELGRIVCTVTEVGGLEKESETKTFSEVDDELFFRYLSD